MSQLQKEVIGLVAKALGVDAGSVTIDSTSADFIEWDSLGHITLLSELDERFEDITIDHPELGSATSVREIVEACEKKASAA